MLIKIFNENVWGWQQIEDRNALTAELILEYGADICGFQEYSKRYRAAEEYEATKKFHSLFCEVPSPAENNFTPIFYRRDRFELKEHGWKLYDGKNDADSKSYTWCRLRDKTSASELIYICTHFWWEYASEEDNIQRLENIRELYELMTELKEKYNIPVIFAGDLNCGENSKQGEAPLMRLGELGLVNLKDIADKSEGHFTHHSYPVLTSAGNYARGGEPCNLLDHAFMLPDENVRVLEYIIDSGDKALSASDHCPIKILIEIDK